jgi:cysteine protease IpaJ
MIKNNGRGSPPLSRVPSNLTRSGVGNPPASERALGGGTMPGPAYPTTAASGPTSAFQPTSTSAPSGRPSPPSNQDLYGGGGQHSTQAPVSLLPPAGPHVPVKAQSGGGFYGTGGRVPLSNLPSLPQIPDMPPPYQAKPNATMMQGYPMSCGAATLVSASMELGRTEFQGTPLDDRFKHPCEGRVYASTSGVSDASKAGYSYPAGIIKTAREMGLEGHVHMVPGFKTGALETFFPGAVNQVNDMGAKVDKGPEVPLHDNQRRLRVLTTQGIGLHYVMERPNGSVMDPATGKTYKNLDTLVKDAGWSKNYSDTGLSVVLTDPSWPPKNTTT